MSLVSVLAIHLCLFSNEILHRNHALGMICGIDRRVYLVLNRRSFNVRAIITCYYNDIPMSKPVHRVLFLLFKNNTHNTYCSVSKVFMKTCLLASRKRNQITTHYICNTAFHCFSCFIFSCQDSYKETQDFFHSFLIHFP